MTLTHKLKEKAMTISTYITSACKEAKRVGLLVLNQKELAFVSSIYAQSQRAGFTGMSAKQAAWFDAIAVKLEAVEGMMGFEIVAARRPGAFNRARNEYLSACAGW